MKKLLTALAAACGLAASTFAATVNLANVNYYKTFANGDVIYGTLGSNVSLNIADGATVTLIDVVINGVDNNNYAWSGLTCEGNATIVLVGNNMVKGFYNYFPGIYIPDSKTLVIKGNGSLVASSNGRAAGIGGGLSLSSCGNIVIEGGTITATGGSYAAGIGSGLSGTCGDITITKGVMRVAATKGTDAPYSIGRGNNGTCGSDDRRCRDG